MDQSCKGEIDKPTLRKRGAAHRRYRFTFNRPSKRHPEDERWIAANIAGRAEFAYYPDGCFGYAFEDEADAMLFALYSGVSMIVREIDGDDDE
jgi:hypothetical protein